MMHSYGSKLYCKQQESLVLILVLMDDALVLNSLLQNGAKIVKS